MTKLIRLTFTNDSTETIRVRHWTRDRHGVVWWVTMGQEWRHSFLVRAVEEVKSGV